MKELHKNMRNPKKTLFGQYRQFLRDIFSVYKKDFIHLT